MAKKKNPISWLTQVFDMFGDLLDIVKTESEEKMQQIKKKVKFYMTVYGLFTVALFFILIGVIKELPKFFEITEGLAFIIVGCVMSISLICDKRDSAGLPHSTFSSTELIEYALFRLI